MHPQDELVAQWLNRADDDLRLAELALQAEPPVCWGAAFHAQQAVEKLLKAVLTHHSVEFARTHAIDYLLQLCTSVEPEVEQLGEAAISLTDFAVAARYPLPGRDPSVEEAREALKIAQEARVVIHSLVPTQRPDAT